MGKAFEIVSAKSTAIGTTLAAMSPVTGDSFTIRDGSRDVVLTGMINARQTAGNLRITSPSLHDNTYGIQQAVNASSGGNVLSIFEYPQQLRHQDTLTIQGTGSATAGDIEHSSLLVYYEDLPGIDANMITPAVLKRRAVNHFDQIVTITAGTSGDWTGAELITAEQDAFRANTDYALIGCSVRNNPCHAIGVYGPDFGNLRVGMPGNPDVNNVYTNGQWYLAMAAITGLPLIPVINSANKSLTYFDVLQDENGADPVIAFHWIELK